MKGIAQWGRRPTPLLPEILRDRWADELPTWVTAELNLPLGSTFAVLGTSLWKTFAGTEVSQRVRSFLVNVLKNRLTEARDLCLIRYAWPKSLDPRHVPWSARTRNCLEKAHLLEDPAGLAKLTVQELLRIRAMGVTSLLDFACVAEAVLTAGRTLHPEAETESLDILALIESDWAAQISSEDPRLADVIPPGSGTLYERVDRLTAEPQDPPLEENELAAAIPGIRRRIDQLGTASLEVALIELVKGVSHLEGKRLHALARRLGIDGRPSATLEEAGSLIGLTRERMRQLQQNFEQRLPSHQLFLPQLDRAIEIVEKAAPCSTKRVAAALQEAGLTKITFDVESLIAAADLLKRPIAFELDPSVGRIRRRDSARREQFMRSVAHRQASASGVSNVQQVIAEIESHGSCGTSEEVHEYLESSHEFEFLDSNWYWYPPAPADRNRLRNLTRKMLSVAAVIAVAELREGIRRHYRMRSSRGLGTWPLVVPPKAVLLKFYMAHPEFSVDSEETVASTVSLDYRQELNPTEQILVDAIRSSPSQVLDRETLVRRCVDQHGMNGNTFSQYLYSSSVINHLGTDLWSLRGIQIDPAAVEAVRQANAVRPREKRVVDHGWTDDGDLWIVARVPHEPLRFVLGIPAPIRHLLGEQEFAAVDNTGVPSGIVRTNADGMSYGYGSFLNRKGGDENDLLLATFHLSQKQVELCLIDDDILDEMSPTSD